MLFFWTFGSSKNPEKCLTVKNIKQLFATLIIIRNVSWTPNQHRMISEGSCDTEDWSNDAENSAFQSQE